MEKQNSPCEHGQPTAKSKRLALHMRLRCGSLSITIQVSLPANEFDVRSVRHVQLLIKCMSFMRL